MREELKRFAEFQEKVLRDNDFKGRWDHHSVEDLFLGLVEEVGELAKGFCNVDVDNIMLECADIANYAMMIFDKLDKLQKSNEVENSEM